MDILRIADPPRRVPLGARLALFTHREITGSLAWSIPAAVCLLLSAIAQPLPGARIALIALGAACLYNAAHIARPQLARALRSIRRMRSGRLTIGRIAACRHWKGALPMRAWADFIKDWDDFDRRELFKQGTGCLIRFVGIFLGVPFTLFFVFMASSAIAKLFGVGVEGLTSTIFLKLVGMTILVAAVFNVFVGIVQLVELWQFGDSTPGYQAPKQAPADVEAFRHALLAVKDPAPGRDFPSDDYAAELVCKVEYAGFDKIHAVETRTRFSPRMNRSGVEAVLFDPTAPGEIDLVASFPDTVQIVDGQWARAPIFGPLVAVMITAAVFLAAFGALAFEGYWLVTR